MKRILFFVAIVCALASCKESAPKYANRAEAIAAQIHDPDPALYSEYHKRQYHYYRCRETDMDDP